MQRLLAGLVWAAILTHASCEYLVGVGKADITGPIADVNLMGYANPGQFAGGLLTRLYARSLIVADANRSDERWVFVNMDAGMASQAVTFTVIAQLRERYGGLYSERNVALSGTHTHSGPSGYLQHLVYGVLSLGFYKPTFDVLVDGVVQSIVEAHESLRPGSLGTAAGELLNANINRSPTAYLHNPPEERALYAHDIDKEMTLLRVDDGEEGGEEPRAVFSWFPVHGTSVNNTNTLVNGDNKGVASQIFEKAHRGTVAAFCQANVGDTSPNVLGARCRDTGEPCDAVHSTCNGRVAECIGRGPAWPDDVASCRIIAERQAEAAEKLTRDAASRTVSGPVDSRHAFLYMPGMEVAASNFTHAGRACKAAMGMSFAAGTTDGPGAFDFKQGDTNGTAFWRLVRNFITKPGPEQIACHAPKPILLDVGEMHFPYDWAPSVVEVGVLRAGDFVVLAVPGELTTMAGRRLRRAVRAALDGAWGPRPTLVVAGLTNTYSSYVTTFEEYQAQRYEGGFTLFGPHTLDVYIQEITRLVRDMVAGAPPEPERVQPPNLLAKQWSLVPPVVTDSAGWGGTFGKAVEDVAPGAAFQPGDMVKVTFQSACPRNNVRRSTFLTVERWVGPARGGRPGAEPHISAQDQGWEVVATDDDWATRFAWYRHHDWSPLSFAGVSWIIPQDTLPGRYRIGHHGDAKHILGSVEPFSGYSSEFVVGGASTQAHKLPFVGALVRWWRRMVAIVSP